MTETKQTMNAADILRLALDNQNDAIYPAAHRLISQAFPTHFLLETTSPFFRPWHKTDLWKIKVHHREDLESQIEHRWDPGENQPYRGFFSGWLEAEWSGSTIQLVGIGMNSGYCRSKRWFILADTQEIAEGFFSEVCRHFSEVKKEVLVFQEGDWYPDADLYNSIQGAKLDDLVLAGDLNAQIETDLQVFLEQMQTYERYRIPWKRGLIFLGPPGNGKTHMIKALVNRFALPCLYVKSLSGHQVSSQQCIASAFERAREVAPCLFVLEDLDTLLTDENRSYFLNEMDGFASNHGIITIASCNFPEKLDAAILERPSRFDRKYHFDLPDDVGRRRFVEVFMSRFDEELRLDEAGLDKVAEATYGYSFAYLKELYVSSAVRWISNERHRTIGEVMADQSVVLRDQMMTTQLPESHKPKPAKRRPRRMGGSFTITQD